MHTADDGLTVSLPVKAGTHEVGVSFVRRHWEPEGILQPPQRGFARTTNELYFGNPAVDIVSIAGPVSGQRRGRHPSRRAVFTCRPAREPAAARRDDARGPSSRDWPAARIAGRSPTADLETLLAFYRAGQARGGIRGRHPARTPPNPGLAQLPVPHRARAGERGRPARRIASATSISRRDSRSSCGAASPTMNCSTRPRAARSATPAVLEQQVRRMLADRASQALVDNFASQWLTLGKLAGVVPDVDAYPEFDENLREAFRQETRPLRQPLSCARIAASANC